MILVNDVKVCCQCVVAVGGRTNECGTLDIRKSAHEATGKAGEAIVGIWRRESAAKQVVQTSVVVDGAREGGRGGGRARNHQAGAIKFGSILLSEAQPVTDSMVGIGECWSSRL